jgi:ubiquinone/menaquinone biosynthesis C-methylase UbiE
VTTGFWDKRAQKYNDEIEKHDAVYMQTIESTKSLLSASDVVLDLGCASGEFSLDIAPCVQRVLGIDTSTNMITMATEKATAHSAGNATFASTDLFDRSLDAHGYTRVLAFSFLHLVEDLPAVLGRINRLLATGGLLISETPCFGERGLLFNLFVGIAQRVKIAPPIFRLTVPELEAAIAGADFDITESKEWDPKNAIHWIVARKRHGAS